MEKVVNGKVAVLGLGKMGATLAAVLLKDGYSVRVWNRTASKADALVAAGAEYFASPAEAAATADIVVLCVSDHTSGLEVLSFDRGCSIKAGGTLVQLSSVSSEESQQMAKLLENVGVEYLDGSILGYHEMVKDGQCSVVYSGNKANYDRFEHILRSLGGHPRHISDKVGSATSFDKTLFAFAYGSWISYLHGAALCHASGFPLEAFVDEIDRYPCMPMLKNLGDMIVVRKYPGDQATLEVEAAVYQQVVDTTEKLGVDPSLTKLVKSYFDRSIAEGHGKKSLAAMFETMIKKD